VGNSATFVVRHSVYPLPQRLFRMRSDNPGSRYLSLIGSTLLLALAIAGLLLATDVVVPSAQYLTQLYGIRVPAFFNGAIPIGKVCSHLLYPLEFTGFALLVGALLRRKLPRTAAACQTALSVLAGVVASLSIYLLGSGGIAQKLASGGQYSEIKFYKRTLEEFALLEAAEGRFKEFVESAKRSPELKMVEVKSASQFNNAEARERISRLIAALPKATNIESKRRILATLSLFRNRLPPGAPYWPDIVPHAVEAGAPPSNSHAETLEWIAANLNKDGWDPLPLFKLGR
jgi:hypothetical protein